MVCKDMKKFVLTALLALAAYCVAWAQGATQEELRARITAASASMKSLQCDFVQVKEISILADKITSRGTLSYKGGDRLRWLYTEPYRYEFTMNGSRVKVGVASGVRVVDTRSNRLFREISGIISSSVDGRIFSSESFDVTLREEGGRIVADMTPRSRELKGMFRGVKIRFATDCTVESVEMSEPSGDRTEITFRNKRLNCEIDDRIFAVD